MNKGVILVEGKLDRKDYKILELVTEDGRLPMKKLASAVKLSREAAAYRLRRLQELDILRNCVAKIDMTKFYQSSYYVVFRFRKVSPEMMKRRVEFLVQSPYVMWVGTFSGKYDLAASFLTRDTSDLTDFVRSIEENFGEGVEYELLTYTREFKNSFKDTFRTAQGLPQPAAGFMMKTFSPKQIVDLDDTDRLILYILSKNSKSTNAELAEITHLSEEGVRQRIKNLEKAGIIRGYRYLINIYNLGLEVYTILFRFQGMTREKEDELMTYIQTNPHVYYSARFIGRYNLAVGLTAKDRFQLQEILDGFRNRFSDFLYDTDTHIIFGEYKHTYLPPAAFRDIKGFDKIEKDYEKKYGFTHEAKSVDS